MNHEEAWSLLNDYVDHDLPEAKRVELDAHLRECETCRHEVDQLRAIVETAGTLPRSIEPERDLWAGISTGIRPERAVRPGWFDRFLESMKPGRGWWPVAVPVAAAVILLIVVFGDRGPGTPGPQPDPSTLTRTVAPDPAAAMIGALEAETRQGDLELAEYTEEAGGIENVPVLGLIVENIRIIDRSIDELKEAWAANPDSPRIARMLAAAYQTRILLQGRGSRVAAETQG